MLKIRVLLTTLMKKPGVDYFNNETFDPSETNAMRSSLWEIDTLRHLYCPPVSRFILSLENDLTVRAKTTKIVVKDFSFGSYATIFGEEEFGDIFLMGIFGNILDRLVWCDFEMSGGFGELAREQPEYPFSSSDNTNGNVGDFKCHVCFDSAQDPIVTLVAILPIFFFVKL
ncbi:hypothetical protein QQ045_014028 [Rhodiola kirilowii]